MAGRLIAAPGVFVPIACAAGFLGRHAADMVIQQAEHVGEAIDAKLADDAVNGQVRAHLDHAGAGAFDLVEHPLLVAVLLQTCRALVAAVGSGNGEERFGHVLGDLVPRQPHVAIVATVVEHVLRPQFGMIRQGRTAGVDPLFPALPQHRALQPIGPVDAPLHGEAFGATAWVPSLGGLVAV